MLRWHAFPERYFRIDLNIFYMCMHMLQNTGRYWNKWKLWHKIVWSYKWVRNLLVYLHVYLLILILLESFLNLKCDLHKNLPKVICKIFVKNVTNISYHFLTTMNALRGSWTADTIWKCIWKRRCKYCSCKFYHSTLCILNCLIHNEIISKKNFYILKQSVTGLLWFMVKPVTSDIWMTHEYIRVTYGWYTSTYEWHTNAIQMACKIILNCLFEAFEDSRP